MYDYCDGCKHLSTRLNKCKPLWRCSKFYYETSYEALIDSKNEKPIRLFACKENNWYESNNKKQESKMALKEISVKEALQMLAEKYPEPVEGWFWYDEQDKKDKGILNISAENEKHPFNRKYIGNYPHFAIEVPNEYRYMTPEEHAAWLVTVGYKDHQMRSKNSYWFKPFNLDLGGVENYEYRTVKLVDGKIVYGEPQEFRVRVEN